MAYSTALEEEEEAGWQCCMPPRGSFGVLSRAQGAAEGVRSRDNPPPQPRPVEAHLQASEPRALGAKCSVTLRASLLLEQANIRFASCVPF